MATAFELLKRRMLGVKSKTEEIDNPLRMKIGSSVQLDVLDYREMTFFVQEVREVTQVVGSQKFPMPEYVLLARPLDGPERTIRLRLVPVKNAPKGSADLSHTVVLLSKYDELGWDQNFRDILNENEFVCNDNGTEVGRYWRINDVKNSWRYNVRTVDEKNDKNPDVDYYKSNYEVWDYWRSFKEGEAEIREYLYVEMETDNKYFTIWKGEEINANSVDVR